MRISSLASCVLAIVLTGLVACGGDDGDDEGDGNTDELTCANYCTSIMANCTGANQQYSSAAECMSSCAHAPVGLVADTSGNTLGCRSYHAGMPAMTGPDLHCRHAGPGGDGACGDNCLGFCTLVMGACTGANAQYGGNLSMCMTACAAFATTPAYNSMQTSGNTFACRLYHATVASGNPAMHCAHVGASGGPCM